MSSPHIIQVYGHGRVDDCLYLATQYVAGGDFRQILDRRGALPPRLALELCEHVLVALADAHSRGVIHRDVKPSNILLTTSADREFAYLCDFGIAQSGTGGLTQAGLVAGSWAYMAPERHQGEPATVRSDLNSAGCVLWAMLTGHNPYPGTDVQMAMAHVGSPVPSLSGEGPLTDRLNLILARSLAKDPADRYATAADFLRDAQGTLEEVGLPAPAGLLSAGQLDDRTRVRPTTMGGRPLQLQCGSPHQAPATGVGRAARAPRRRALTTVHRHPLAPVLLTAGRPTSP
jgi:serine/threonine protein kinase